MESTKIRALTQLCLELKQRRETLIEQWGSTQSYLDTKQQSLEHEFRALQQDNQMLFDNVEHLQKALGGFHADWKDYLQQMLGLQRELRQLGSEYQELQQDFGTLHTEMRLIQNHLSQHAEVDDEAKIAFEDLEKRLQKQTEELQSTYEKYQSQQNLLEKMYQQKSVQSEQVDTVKTELSGLQGHFQQLGIDVKRIHTEIEAYKTRWQAEYNAQQNAFSDLRTEHDALSDQYQGLSDQHQNLQQQHAALQALQLQKETEYSASFARHEAYQTQVKALSEESSRALSALHEEYDALQSDTHSLLTALKMLKSRWLKDQEEHTLLEKRFAEQEAKFAVQEEKFTDLEAQSTLHLSRIHALEAENKGYETDLYELSEQVDAQKLQLETQQSGYEAKLAALTEAQELAQETHEAQLAELEATLSSQQSDYEAKLAALTETQELAQETHEAQLAELESTLSSQQSDYEAKLAALTEAQELAQETHEAQLAELESTLSSQQSDYEAKLAALTETQELAQETHEAQLAELQMANQDRVSEYETQIAALAAAQLLSEQNHQSQLDEYLSQLESLKSESTQQAEKNKALVANYAEQQALASAQQASQEAELAQQQQRLQAYVQGLRDIQEAYDQLVHQAQQSATATTPHQEELETLQERLDDILQKDEQQQEALKITQEDLADARAEQERKQKLLAQLENYGEESETLKSAREELLQEIAQNTQRTESLHQTLTEIESLQKSLAEEQDSLKSEVLQKQQDLQLAEQEMRQRQEQAEQLQAFIEAFGQSEDASGNVPSANVAAASAVHDDLTSSLQARVQALEAEKARMADQLIVQEGELLKQSQEIERLENLEHQEVFVPLDQGSQPHLDQVISEEVAQISSLLSELNFGGEVDADDNDDSFTDVFPVVDLPKAERSEVKVPVSEPEPELESSIAQAQLPTIYVYTHKVEPTLELRTQLADYLSQYRHQVNWIDRLEQLQAVGAKGVVFLLTPEEKIDTAVLQHVKQAKIAYVEHVMSNITRLKIAVLDAFIG